MGDKRKKKMGGIEQRAYQIHIQHMEGGKEIGYEWVFVFQQQPISSSV